MNTIRSKDGTSIAFDRAGSGKPLILVGGALSDRMAAKELTLFLAPHFDVYAYDRRGKGDSGDTLPYSIEREIEDIAALMSHSGGPVSVFGHSSGAVLALEAAVRLPGITRLALYEPPFIVDNSRDPTPPDYVARIAAMIDAKRAGDAVEYFMTVMVGAPKEAVAQMRGSPAWPTLEKYAPTLVYDLTIMGDNLLGNKLKAGAWARLAIPTLVMDGGASPEWAHAGVQALFEALPNAKRRTLEGQTHGAASAVLAPILTEFLSA